MPLDTNSQAATGNPVHAVEDSALAVLQQNPTQPEMLCAVAPVCLLESANLTAVSDAEWVML